MSCKVMTLDTLSRSILPSSFRDFPERSVKPSRSSVPCSKRGSQHYRYQTSANRLYNSQPTKHVCQQTAAEVTKSSIFIRGGDVSCGFQLQKGLEGSSFTRNSIRCVPENGSHRNSKTLESNTNHWQRRSSRSQANLDTWKGTGDLDISESKQTGAAAPLHLLKESEGRGRGRNDAVDITNVLSSSCTSAVPVEPGSSNGEIAGARHLESRVLVRFQSHGSRDASQSHEENIERRDGRDADRDSELGFVKGIPSLESKEEEVNGSFFSSVIGDPKVEEALKDKRVGAVAPLPKTLSFQSSQKSNHVKAAWESLVRWSRSWRSSKNSEDDALVKTKKIAIFGGGSFGTAMGVMLARNKEEMDIVMLLRDPNVCDEINSHQTNKKFFPNHKLPENVRATTDPREALDGAQYCIHAVPVQASTEFLKGIAEYIPPTLPILSVSKGLEVSTLEMMSQLIPRALGNPRQPVAVLSGPTFSIELMDRRPTAIVAASKDKQLARAAQQLLASRYLRVNTSSDVVGVEMAGALKNVLAIAAGIVEGMSLGNNCMAALVAQGCAEIRWLAEKMGANPATLSGLSGTGDIMLTCFVSLSRNRSVGVRLGAGEKLEDILSSMNQVAEGVATAGAVIALARKYRVQMPVLTAVARILENELTPKKAVLELMTLPQVEER